MSHRAQLLVLPGQSKTFTIYLKKNKNSNSEYNVRRALATTIVYSKHDSPELHAYSKSNNSHGYTTLHR